MSFEEQIMFKDKYPSRFSPQMKAIVFVYARMNQMRITSNRLRNTRSFQSRGIFLDIQSCDVFRPIVQVKRLTDVIDNYY